MEAYRRICMVMALVVGVAALGATQAAWAGSSKGKTGKKHQAHANGLTIRVTRNMTSGVSHVYEVKCPKGSEPTDLCELRRFSSAGEQDRFSTINRSDAINVASRLGARVPASRMPNSKSKAKQLKPMLSWQVSVPNAGRKRGQVNHGEFRHADPDKKRVAAAIGLLEASLKAAPSSQY